MTDEMAPTAHRPAMVLPIEEALDAAQSQVDKLISSFKEEPIYPDDYSEKLAKEYAKSVCGQSKGDLACEICKCYQCYLGAIDYALDETFKRKKRMNNDCHMQRL